MIICDNVSAELHLVVVNFYFYSRGEIDHVSYNENPWQILYRTINWYPKLMHIVIPVGVACSATCRRIEPTVWNFYRAPDVVLRCIIAFRNNESNQVVFDEALSLCARFFADRRSCVDQNSFSFPTGERQRDWP